MGDAQEQEQKAKESITALRKKHAQVREKQVLVVLVHMLQLTYFYVTLCLYEVLKLDFSNTDLPIGPTARSGGV